MFDRRLLLARFSRPSEGQRTARDVDNRAAFPESTAADSAA